MNLYKLCIFVAVLIITGNISSTPNFDNNPLYKSKYTDREIRCDWDGNPTYWIELSAEPKKAATDPRQLPPKYLPYLGVSFYPKEQNITVNDISKSLENSLIQKGGELFGSLPYGFRKPITFKVDVEGLANSVAIKYEDNPSTAALIKELMELITFQAIYDDYNVAQSQVYQANVIFEWKQVEEIGRLNLQRARKSARYQLHQERCRVGDVLQSHEEQLAQKKEALENEQRIARAAQELEIKLAKERQEKEDLIREQQAKRKEIYSKHIAPVVHEVVWSTSEQTSLRMSTSKELFDRINKSYYEAVNIPLHKRVFSPTKKGEFEKTESYEARIIEEKEEFNKSILDEENNLNTNKHEMLEKILNNALGEAAFTSINYNADKEMFLIGLSSKAGFSIEGSFPYAIEEAPSFKDKIAYLKPWILFSLDSNDILNLETVVLQKNMTVIELDLNTKFSVKLDDQSYNEYKARMNREATDKKLRNEKENREWEERQALRRKSWPKNTVGEIEAGKIFCLSQKSAYRANVIQRSGNTFAAHSDDCFNLPKKIFLSSVTQLATGIARVSSHGSTTEAYVSMSDVIQ